MPAPTHTWARWWRYQRFLVATAIAVYAILWVNKNPGDPLVVLVYSFCLGNLNFLAVDTLWIRQVHRAAPMRWLVFLFVELLLIPPIVIVASAIGFVVLGSRHMSGPFWQYLAEGWKIPAFMTLLFGTGFAFYREMEERLERRNRDLQHAVEREVAGRELQEQDLERAREIQQALLPKEVAQVPGFEVVAAWEPARLVGGDYYDVIRLTPTKLAICIADVVGKASPQHCSWPTYRPLCAPMHLKLPRPPGSAPGSMKSYAAISPPTSSLPCSTEFSMPRPAGSTTPTRGTCPRYWFVPPAARNSLPSAEPCWASFVTGNMKPQSLASKPATAFCSLPTASPRRLVLTGKNSAKRASSRPFAPQPVSLPLT